TAPATALAASSRSTCSKKSTVRWCPRWCAFRCLSRLPRRNSRLQKSGGAAGAHPMLKHLTTEARNPASEVIDTLTPLEIVRLMNAEDALVAPAVAAQAEQIAAAIDVI